MKAMILAAGLGTRLRPLTDNRPKALVEIAGRTLLEITLSRLRAFAVSDAIINVHHFADMILGYLKTNKNFGMRIEISREDLLLDTGGGLKKAAWFFLEDPPADQLVARHSLSEPFLLHNVDVISTIDLRRMLKFHVENHALATLAVQDRESSRYLLFDDRLQLRGRRINNHDTLVSDLAGAGAKVCHSERSEESAFRQIDASSQSDAMFTHRADDSEAHSPLATPPAQAGRHSPLLHPLAFSGIHVISPRLLPMITEQGVFSIIDTYLRLAASGEKILAFRADEYYWRDLGRPADLAQAAHDLPQKDLF